MSETYTVHGALARVFALKDGIENWMSVQAYELSDPQEISTAKWMGGELS